MSAQYQLDIDLPAKALLDQHQKHLGIALQRQKAIWLDFGPNRAGVDAEGPIFANSITTRHEFTHRKATNPPKAPVSMDFSDGVGFFAGQSKALYCKMPKNMGSCFSVGVKFQADPNGVTDILSLTDAQSPPLILAQEGRNITLGIRQAKGLKYRAQDAGAEQFLLFSYNKDRLALQVGGNEVQKIEVPRCPVNACFLGAAPSDTTSTRSRGNLWLSDVMIWPNFDILDPTRRTFPRLHKVVIEYFDDAI